MASGAPSGSRQIGKPPAGAKPADAAAPIVIPAELKHAIKPGSEGIEVRAVKAMLNVVVRSALDSASPKFDASTEHAVRAFQRLEKLGVDGRVGPNTYPKLLQAYRLHYRLRNDLATPQWLRVAYREMGQAEVEGAESNPRIVEYLNTCPALKNAHTKTLQAQVLDKKTGKPRLGTDGKPKMRKVWDTNSPTYAEIDETAWCAAFVNWCLKKSGLPGLDTNSAGLAEAWLDYGMPIETPRFGAITVIYKASAASSALTSTGNHVGFLVDGGLGDSVTLLGGNQGNQVKLSRFSGWQIKGFLWPGAD